MPKFLNTLNMSSNEIQNFVVHNTSSGIAVAGAMILDGTVLKYHNGTSYITLGDSDTVSTNGAGLAPQLPASHGGKFLKADGTYAVPAYIANTNTFRTVSLDTNGNGSVNDTLDAAETLVFKKGTNITLAESGGVVTISSTDTDTQLDNSGVTGMALTGMVTSSTADVAATDTILAAIGKLEARTALNDDKITNTNTQNNASTIRTLIGTGNSGVVPALGTTGHFLKHDGSFGLPSYTTNTNTNQLTTFAVRDSANADKTIAHGKFIKFVTATGALGTATTGTGTTGDPFLVTLTSPNTQIANTDVDVSVGNLETRLGEIDTSVTIGNATSVDTTISGDLTVTGDLLVSGDTTTLNTSTLEVEDLNITVAKGAASAAAADGAGLTVDGASATLLYRSTGDKFVFNKALHATSFSGALALSDLDIDGATALGAKPDAGDLMIIDDGAGGTNKSITVTNLKTFMQDNLTFTTNTNTVDMGSGFTVSATTDTTATVITENDDLFFAAGTGITCETTADGTVTITNTIANTNTNQLTTFNIGVDTNSNNTVVAHGETLTFTGGTGISTETTADGTITFTNDSPNIVQTAITGNAGTATVLAAGAVGGVKVVELTHGVDGVVNENGSNSTDSAIWTITHGMGNGRFYKVEVLQDSGDYDTVYVDVQRPSDTTVKITFGADVVNGAYRAMLTRMA